MKLSVILPRILFLSLCTILSVMIAATEKNAQNTLFNPLFCGFFGLAFGATVLGLDFFLQKIDLRSFNAATFGIILGYLLGGALVSSILAVLDAGSVVLSPFVSAAVSSGVFLTTCYLGMVLTMRASDELHACFPFIKFLPASQKRKDFIPDLSALSDPRLIDLAVTGIIDQRLVIPHFIVKNLNELLESDDEGCRSRGRRSLDAITKLEAIPELELRYAETNYADAKDFASKISRAARQLEAHILTAETARSGILGNDGIRYINIHTLSSALKPLSQSGEILNIKIQRYGKEPRQGIGYLEDGTMVVVNGGAEFIGETVRVQVLSVKHTSSGRMIFCNTLEGEAGNELNLAMSAPGASTYFAT
ncbi:MAG: TRAM domain-containing protein [Parachlamydiaceae bacterium]